MTSAIPVQRSNQLSYQANRELINGEFVFNYPVDGEMNVNIWNDHIFELRIKIIYNYMKIISVKMFKLEQLKTRNLKKFRLERESNPWPLRYQCSALTNWAIKPTGSWSIESSYLRADVWNYRESGVSREISNFFLFSPSNPYSEVFSKITLKVSTAFYFFRNRAKFENTAYRSPSNSETGGK